VSAEPAQQLARWHQVGLKPQLGVGPKPENEEYSMPLDCKQKRVWRCVVDASDSGDCNIESQVHHEKGSFISG